MQDRPQHAPLQAEHRSPNGEVEHIYTVNPCDDPRFQAGGLARTAQVALELGTWAAVVLVANDRSSVTYTLAEP